MDKYSTLKIDDKCGLKVPSNRRPWDSHVHTMKEEIYLNERVIRALNFQNKFKLSMIDDKPMATKDGSLYKYYCPQCGREMLLTKQESHSPYKICDSCTSTVTKILYDDFKPLTEAWIKIISQNYDPVDTGELTAPLKVEKRWTDPLVFVTDIIHEYDLDKLKAVAGLKFKNVVLVLKKGNQWSFENTKLKMEEKTDEKKKRVIVYL